MSFIKKLWADRVSENPTRRTLKNVATNEEMIVDVTRTEGEVSQEGDAFSAENMNDLETRIANEFHELSSNLDGISKEIQTLKSDDWKFLGSHNIGVAGASFTLPGDWKEVAITLKPNDTVGGVALGTHLKCAIINSAITQARFGTYDYGIVYNISNNGNTFTYANYFSASMASTMIDVYYK